MRETGRDAYLWMALITSLYLILGLLMSLQVPLGEAPDELDHFLYASYLAREKAFPPLSPVAAENPTMEANQPPLYYLLGAAAAGSSDRGDPFDLAQNSCFSFAPEDPGRQTFYVHNMNEAWPYTDAVLGFHLVRLLSLLMGAGTVWLTFWLGRLVVPADTRAALLGAALLAFNPQFIFITASVNNDVLAATLGAAIVLVSSASWRRPRPGLYFLLGLLVSLGALTKAGLLALWPVALLAACAPLAKKLFSPPDAANSWAQALRDSLLPLALVFGLPVILGGWWYARATWLYGDPLAWRVHLAAKGPFVLREGGLGLQDLGEFASLHFRSYWALFGWLNVAVPDWIYWLLGLFVGTAAAGLVWSITACLRRGHHREPADTDCFYDRAALGLTLLAILATYISLGRYIQTINWSGYQGRLAYAVAGPVVVVLASGLTFLAHRAGGRLLSRLLLWAAPAFLLVLATASILLLLPNAYARPGIHQQTGLAQACARFGDGLLVDGFTTADRVSPGQILEMTLAGYGMEGMPGSSVVRVELRDDQGQVWGSSETAVSWAPGETVMLDLAFPVSATADPGRATLFAGLLDVDGEWRAAISANGHDLTVPVALQTIKIPQQGQPAGQPQTAVTADLGQQLRLLGFDLQGDGATAMVTLYWKALAPMSKDYSTFVHILDADGRLLAQADGQPQDGLYPTAIWDVGELVHDPKVIPLPAESVQGPLQLVTGAYHLPGGERLTLDGDTADSILLATIDNLASLSAQGDRP